MQKGVQVAHRAPLYLISPAAHAEYWAVVDSKRTISFQQSMGPKADVDARLGFAGQRQKKQLLSI
jgi:hypothetical protein